MALSIISNLYANLIYPTNNQVIYSTHIFFEWEQQPDTDIYNIKISADEKFDNIVVDLLTEYPFVKIENNINWNEDYYWKISKVKNGNTVSIGESHFHIGSDKTNEEVHININQTSDEELTILGISNNTNNRSFVIDRNGNEIWNDGDLNVMLNYSDNIGRLFGAQDVDWAWTSGIKFNFNNEVVWREPSNITFDTHELLQIKNGNYMGFISEFQNGPIPIGTWSEYFQDLGYQADGITNEFPWLAHRLVEIDYDSGEIVWDWNPFDYYTLLDYDAYGDSWQKTINSSLSYYDWLHANSFYFDEENNHIYISHRHLSRIVKVDYESGEIIWIVGPSSDFIYSGDEHLCNNLLFSYQHNISLLDNGNLLILDNGNLSRLFRGLEIPISRVLEVNIEDDCQVIWEYEIEEDFFSHSMGSVSKLSNGNYLVGLFVDGGTILEINNSKEIVWHATINSNFIYRVYRISSINPSKFAIKIHNYSLIDDSSTPIYGVLDEDNFQFELCNNSNKEREYIYSINDSNGLFSNMNNEILVSSNTCKTITIAPENFINILTSISLSVHQKFFPDVVKQYDISFLNNDFMSPPEDYKLLGCYPNPFNPSINIQFEVPEYSDIAIQILDLNGKIITNVFNGFKTSGLYTIIWNGENYTSGTYIVRMSSDLFTTSQKITLVK